ncbi:cell division protein CrgA [Gordonia crocea]|uniref:Cell division protein CrgA n=1 Tax=Gordonia crocea TaxID=589162 RepID=A0A7M3SU95_9ACTN|nr:cell division protein CrgA [Gordonia crocea]GED96219.1 cell division protein CrgA [Gordonia crocea]
MPKSKVRKKTDYTISSASRTPVKVKAGPSGLIYQSVMFGLMLLGLVWLIVYYLAAQTGLYSNDGQFLKWMADLGAWNFLIGFALMVAGLLMTMRWR